MQNPNRTPRYLIAHLQVMIAFCLTLYAGSVAPLFAIGQQPDSKQVDFASDVAPLLTKNCVACHNKADAEGGLNLETHADLMNGGESGPAVVVGKPKEGELLARIQDDDDPMPPEDNTVGAKRLTDAETDLLRRWIKAGALAPSAMAKQAIQWRALPESVRPIYAMQYSQDGQYIIYGRGNSVVTESAEKAGEIGTQLLVDPALESRTTHHDIVQSVSISRDSEWIASGGYRTLKIWQRPIHESAVLNGLPTNASLVTFSPDRNRVAYTVGARALEIVNLKAGQAVRLLKAHSAPITCVAWDATGAEVVSGDSGGHISMTDVATYSTREVMQDPALVFEQLVHAGGRFWFGRSKNGDLNRISIGGKVAVASRVGDVSNVADIRLLGGELPQLAVARRSGIVTLHDVDSGSEQLRFKVEHSLKRLAVSNSGSRLVVISDSGHATLWSRFGELIAGLDEDYGESRNRDRSDRTAKRKAAQVASLKAQLPQLKTAAEKEKEALKKVQETRDKAAEELAASETEFTEAARVVSETESALSAAQALLETAKKKVETATEEVAAKKKAADAAKTKKVAATEKLSMRDEALAAAKVSAKAAEQRIDQLSDQIDGESVRLEKANDELSAAEEASKLPVPVVTVAFAAEDQIAVVGNDRMVRLFDSDSGIPLRNCEVDLVAAAANGDGLIALSSSGGVLDLRLPTVWDLSGTIGTAEDSPLSDRVTALDFSPDGKMLAVGSGPPSRFGDLKIVDPVTQEIVQDFGEVHSDTILCVKFSPDGKFLATAAADKLCRLFDVATGDMLRAFEGHTHHVLSIAWRDDCSSLATASADNTIKVWKVASGEQIRTISGIKKEATALAFVGSTNQLASAAGDSVVRLHNVDDGKQIRSFSGATDALYSLTISADEKLITAAGQAGQLWTWTIADGKLVEQGND